MELVIVKIILAHSLYQELKATCLEHVNGLLVVWQMIVMVMFPFDAENILKQLEIVQLVAELASLQKHPLRDLLKPLLCKERPLHQLYPQLMSPLPKPQTPLKYILCHLV